AAARRACAGDPCRARRGDGHPARRASPRREHARRSADRCAGPEDGLRRGRAPLLRRARRAVLTCLNPAPACCMLSVTQPPRSTMDRPPSPYDTPRPPKSYFGEAVLTLAIYYFGMLIGGFFANLYFLRRAREDR